MKIDEKIILNVLLAMIAYRIMDKLFLGSLIDGITGDFERQIG